MSHSEANVNSIKYIVGGKIGDLFHVLYVVERIYETTGKKGDIYLTNNLDYGGDRFSRDLETTYVELKPILYQQEYVASLNILDDDNCIDTSENVINLNIWRRQNNVTKDWLGLLSMVYHIARTPCSWLAFDQVSSVFLNQNIIHHSMTRYNPSFPWEVTLKNKNFLFITCNPKEYHEFPFKHMCKLVLLSDIQEMICALNSCKFFVGNQSSPAAMAVALGKKCLISLYFVDAHTYKQRDWCNGKCFWFLDPKNKYLDVDKIL